MLKFDYAEYAASEEAVTAARPAAERTAKAIWEKGFSNIFLTAVGGDGPSGLCGTGGGTPGEGP